MKLIAEWRRVLLRAWSIRLLLLAGALSGLELTLPYLDGYVPLPPRTFAAPFRLDGSRCLHRQNRHAKGFLQMASRLRKAVWPERWPGLWLSASSAARKASAPKAYRDIVNVPTSCFGGSPTKGSAEGDTATMDECKAMLGDALVEFERETCAPASPNPDKIPGKPYVAFLSLSYNCIGSRAFCGSTVARKASRW